MTKETVLNEHQGLLKAYAWKIANRWHIDFDDVLGESYLIFCEAFEKFDQTRGIKFSTYLCSQLKALTGGRYHTKDCRPGPHGICQKTAEWRDITAEMHDDAIGESTIHFCNVGELYSEARKVLSANGNWLFLFILKSKKAWKKFELVNELRDTYQWRYPAIYNTWNEVKRFWLNFETYAI